MRWLERFPWWVIEPLRWLLIVRVVGLTLEWADDPTVIAETEYRQLDRYLFPALALVFALPPIDFVAKVRHTDQSLLKDSDIRVVRDTATMLACGLVSVFASSRALIAESIDLSTDRIENSRLTEGDLFEKLLRVGFETVPTFVPDTLGWEDPIMHPSAGVVFIIVVLKLYLGVAVVAAIVRLYHLHKSRDLNASTREG